MQLKLGNIEMKQLWRQSFSKNVC